MFQVISYKDGLSFWLQLHKNIQHKPPSYIHYRVVSQLCMLEASREARSCQGISRNNISLILAFLDPPSPPVSQNQPITNVIYERRSLLKFRSFKEGSPSHTFLYIHYCNSRAHRNKKSKEENILQLCILVPHCPVLLFKK